MFSAAPTTSWIFFWTYGLCACVLGCVVIFVGRRTRMKSAQLMRQLTRERLQADRLTDFVVPIGLSLATETHLDTLLEKILVEAKTLANADGGSLYLATPEKTLRFVMIKNDSLKIAMGGSGGTPVTLAPLPLYDPVTGGANEANIATYCALEARSIAVADVYAPSEFDFSGAKAFDQRMNYRAKSVLCVPLKSTSGKVIGVLQLINAQDAETGRVTTFDSHMCRMMETLGLLAAAALESYLRIKTLTDQITELKIQIDEVKKDKQVAEISESEYFKSLQTKAREMRAKVKGTA